MQISFECICHISRGCLDLFLWKWPVQDNRDMNVNLKELKLYGLLFNANTFNNLYWGWVQYFHFKETAFLCIFVLFGVYFHFSIFFIIYQIFMWNKIFLIIFVTWIVLFFIFISKFVNTVKSFKTFLCQLMDLFVDSCE